MSCGDEGLWYNGEDGCGWRTGCAGPTAEALKADNKHNRRSGQKHMVDHALLCDVDECCAL